YRANPHAFHGNINRMTTGKILRIPSTQQIEQVSASKARREVKLQIADWHAYRNRIAAAASRKSAAAPEAGGAVSGKISTKVEEAHPKGATAPQDVVRLSKGEAPEAAGKGESTTERIQALEEEASARQKALDEANSRIAQLEKTISDMRKLIAIKSAGMANAQQQAQQAASVPASGAAAAGAQAAAQSATPAGSSASASTPASTTSPSAPTAAAGATTAAGSVIEPGAAAAPSGSTAASNSTIEADTTQSNATAESNSAAASQPAAPAESTASPTAATAAATTAASKPETATATAAKESGHGAAGATQPGQSAEKPAAGNAEAKPVAQKAEAATAHAAPRHHIIPKPAPQPGFLQMLTENPLYIGAAVIIILLLIYLWMRRRRGAADDGEPELQAAPLLAGGAAAATTAAALAAVKDSPPAASAPPAASPAASPEPQPAAPAGAISDDVDPLAEAEVYIAYGREEQAEEILKDALVHHPERTDVQVKLLEVYAARKNTTAFETLAQKLHQSVASDSEEWLKVAALGYTLAPANPLFEAGKAAPSSASPASAPDGLDFELDMPAAQTAADIPLDPAPEDDSVSKTGRLSAQFAAAGLELTAPHGAVAPDFTLPGGTPGPEDTQRIAEGENSAADEPAPIPDFTLGRDSNAPTGLDFGAEEHGTASVNGGSGKTLSLEDSQLLMDEALKAARAEPLMPDFQLDLPAAQSDSATADIGHDSGDHAKAPDLALDSGKNGGQPMDLALEPDAAAPGTGKGSVPTFDLSGINLEFDEDQPSATTPASGQKDGHWHDVQTKFDLAKAYQEMGDNDGAKEILHEVVEEGDTEQQTQAKALLRNLG
ncbi:MAG TPA: FimV/HubP family polar landmark protein, partial [Gammaproteobacteria bacterium]|nr:FimV/HubP family polar landmark protein [Gammaproteobacteria bacterium]